MEWFCFPPRAAAGRVFHQWKFRNEQVNRSKKSGYFKYFCINMRTAKKEEDGVFRIPE